MLAKSFVNFCVGCCLLFPGETPRGQVALSVATPLDRELPFRLSHGFLIVVEGQVGGLDKLNLLLDTGTTRSIISRKLADSLHLERHTSQVLNFNRTVSVELAIAPVVRIGPVYKTSVQILVGDLFRFSKFADSIDGIIGMDLLDGNNFTVDFTARKVVFNTVAPNAAIRQAKLTCVTVTIEIQRHPVTLILDTGVQGMLLFERRLYARVPELRTTSPSAEASIGGSMHARAITLFDVHVGQRILRSQALLIEAPSDEILPDIDGFLGVGPLTASQVNFDFVSGTIRWE